MTALFRVKALYEYTSPHEDDLNFDAGQVITVTEEEDDDWYGGVYTDASGTKREGIFPRNFVEKIEPTAPPRPARTRTKKEEPESAAAAPAPVPQPEPEPDVVREDEEEEPHLQRPAEVEERGPPSQSAAPEPSAPAPGPAAAATKPFEEAAASLPKKTEPVAVPAPKAQATSPPPPVSDKPSSNSFKDRIAAFNKAAAPPVAPFKPGALSSGAHSSGGGSGFVKKPFVAAPPSRNAYIPPPQQAPVSKVYRRDEDPEIKEKEAENKVHAEKAGLLPQESSQQEGEEGEDQPKPTTLKERIALLQQQQREQAERHADAAAKKEKPKKPTKKPEPVPIPVGGEGDDEELATPVLSPPARTSTGESAAARPSMEDSRTHEPAPPPRRKPSIRPPVPQPRDGNEADMSGAGDTTEGNDDTTEREDNEEISRQPARPQVPPASVPSVPPRQSLEAQRGQPADNEQEDDEEEEEEAEEEEEIDPEVRRKEELRARMAKMSGGMGFGGMFGGPMPAAAPAPKKKKAATTPKAESAPTAEDMEEPTSPTTAPPVPTMMALPGMGGPRKSEETARSVEDEPTPATRALPPPVPSRQQTAEQEEEDDDETTPAVTPVASATGAPQVAPPVPGVRPAPPPVPAESRPPPPPPPPATGPDSPTDGSASDDELSGAAKDRELDSAGVEAPQPPRLPPMPPQPASAPGLPARSPPTSPGTEDLPPMSPVVTSNKRNSRPPPPVPGSAPAPPPSTSRPPPPPPPGSGGLSRQSTADVQMPPVSLPVRPPQAGEEHESEATEYEGDYDTDIGSSVPHKDALKAHTRESSQEDNTLQSPVELPPSGPPHVPSAPVPRAVPPPVPTQAPQSPPSKRRSVDVPRAAPPPPPSMEPGSPGATPNEFSSYNYSAPTPTLPSRTPRIEEEAYFPDSLQTQQPPAHSPPSGRAPPPPAPSGRGRQSLDVGRKSMSARRSMDQQRPAGESGFIASDLDLAVQSGWWKQAGQVPPVLQGRRDIYFESDESTTTNQGSKTIVTREVWILFQDYSQTIITARYDPYEPSDVELDQRHEPPPRALRQDEMEDFYERFGLPISTAASSKKDSVVGDGTPMALVLELLRPFKEALRPIGSRAFGALVYSNMANASTQQNDVIRPGDILSIRNAKFQGKHGPMHAKYSVEVGKPDHVAIVAEWDGTKKKVRAWEQGRENKKVKMESFKLDDLRSGEVKIWRVMPRSWVGWNTQA